VIREKHNVTQRNVATNNIQLYNASTKASVVVLVRPFATTELRKAANFRKTTVLSSLIRLKEYFNITNKIEFIVFINRITISKTKPRKQTIPTERLPLVGEVSANFSG
jgi:hypothetical protein